MTSLRRTVSRRENGTELIRATFARPTCCPPVVEELVKRAEGWIDHTLLPTVAEVYHNEPSPNKRFSFCRFEYNLSLTLAPASSDIAELRIEATLARARGEMLGAQTLVRYLRLSDGAFVPPAIAQKKHPKVPADKNEPITSARQENSAK